MVSDDDLHASVSGFQKEQARKKKVCSLCAHCIQNPHVRDKRHRPEDTQIQYLCVRRGKSMALKPDMAIHVAIGRNGRERYRHLRRAWRR